MRFMTNEINWIESVVAFEFVRTLEINDSEYTPSSNNSANSFFCLVLILSMLQVQVYQIEF